MPSFRTAVLAAATVFVSTARADYYIDPDSVSSSLRSSWCQSEIATCPLICEDMGASGASVNTCDADKLTYGCLCNDNQTPNVSQYSLTLPYFTCTQWGTQCVAACGSDNTCASACRQDHPCGALDPTAPNSTNTTTTATASTASSTSSGDAAVYTSLGGGSDSSAASGPASLELARLYTTMGALALFSAGFAYLL